MRNIVLIGMMGCGKTSVGRCLAQRLKRRFVDTDQYIEQTEGRSISELFAAEGEGFFRVRERETSEALAQENGLVIACGGGLPTQRESIAALKGSGMVFWLKRDPDQIYDGVSMKDRPLGQQGRLDFLTRYAEREPIYRQWADYEIESGACAQETAQRIEEVLKREISHH